MDSLPACCITRLWQKTFWSASSARKTQSSDRRVGWNQPACLKAEERACACGLPTVHSVAGVAAEAWVVDLAHKWVQLQPPSDGRGRRCLPLHAQRHCFEAAHRQPAIERPQDGALSILHDSHPNPRSCLPVYDLWPANFKDAEWA